MNIEEFSKIYFSKDIRDMVRVYFYYLSQFRDPRHNEICPICRKEYYKSPFRNKLKVEIPFGLRFQSLYSDGQMYMKPLLEDFKKVAKEEFNSELKEEDWRFLAQEYITICEPCSKELEKQKT